MKLPFLIVTLFSVTAMITPFLTVCAQFEEDVTSHTQNREERVNIQEQKPNRVQYRGILPAPKDGVLGGYESAGPDAPGKTSVRRDIGQKIADGTVSLDDIPHLFLYLLNLFTKVATAVGVVMFVWSGFKIVSSSITEDKEGGKNALAYAIAGLVVTFSAWLLSGLIQIQLTSGLGIGDGYTLEESYRESLTGIEGVRSQADENFPLEYPMHLPGAGEDRFRGDVSDLTLWMQNFAGAFTALVTTVAIFFLVNAALKMTLSAGDPDTLEKAKKSLRWIFAGMLLIIFSYVIVKTVISLPYAGQSLSEPETASASP